MSLKAINPANGTLIEEYSTLKADEMAKSIAAATAAQADWRRLSFAERAAVLRRVAEQLREHQVRLSELMTQEMGKPVKEAGPEVEKAAWCAEHYAEHAQAYLADQPIKSEASHSYVCYQPLGTVLGILPWNAPLWLAFRFLAPALMAGNTCVMKHDPHVPGCARAIAEMFSRAGAPENIMINLPIENDLIEQAIAHPGIAAVSFTGSDRTGAKVAAMAASLIKPAVLELGGSDPCVVLADADLETAADIATLSRIINAGQSCIAAKRIIVEAPVYEIFVQLVERRLTLLKVGNPASPETDVGPLALEDLRQNLHRQVEETIAAGARCLMGGQPDTGMGYFYPVTLLADVTPEMTAFREETFGPVMVLIKANDADHALLLANDTKYGLGASVWTTNPAQAQRFIRELQAGQVAVNGIVKTDPRLPSGGVKRSGYGRELGPQGIHEFVNAKQVWVK
ncbi:NAD-dependent succinate-semialdehyde dehydrogenase [Photobacterium galatheae]|uniref:Succinate-semialdehyde dehydrogenase n=1 Tax=Photobacterium galatheae TaxID=1654360 RepID=A0A066RS77_9GAMM|nr:NAD-dependent succinate-semialdehyde dehydrogenase [Photobacterium galatheae]KDM90238.1 succinate-semialdehyde dehydrogenase [Photobacterium galatheae]MCM0151499.1 NAD-dependent succinate-semialdehyde dehydrogenase [Photobacterium galatheae]